MPVHRLKLPPRKSSRQQQETSRCKDSEPLPPLPTESNQLISASFDGPPSPRSSSNASEASASGSSSRKKHREKPIVAPPPLITDASTLTHFQPPSTPLHSSGPSSPFRALLLQPIQPPLPFVYAGLRSFLRTSDAYIHFRSDEAKLITLVISGQRFTISYSALTQKPSKLAGEWSCSYFTNASADIAQTLYRICCSQKVLLKLLSQHQQQRLTEQSISSDSRQCQRLWTYPVSIRIPRSLNQQ